MPLTSIAENVARQALLAKRAGRALAALSTDQKDKALNAMAAALESNAKEILFHNEIDVEAARETGMASALIDRLILTPASVQGMAQGVREIARQKDPIGEVLESWTRPNGI